jgi:hypothetical protein
MYIINYIYSSDNIYNNNNYNNNNLLMNIGIENVYKYQYKKFKCYSILLL